MSEVTLKTEKATRNGGSAQKSEHLGWTRKLELKGRDKDGKEVIVQKPSADDGFEPLKALTEQVGKNSGLFCALTEGLRKAVEEQGGSDAVIAAAKENGGKISVEISFGGKSKKK